jgi:hypothetical protein
MFIITDSCVRQQLRLLGRGKDVLCSRLYK